jgi:cohesin complex subunit SCC1
MFFSTYVLTKKGPLAKVWLAAHWDKKLTKNEVRVIDLSQTVLQIVKPAVPIALRTSGELMLGVVRIYSLKVKHVQKDAVEVATFLLRPTVAPPGMILGAKGVEGAMVLGKTKEHAMGAVTMDIVVGRAGIDQLCEADFSDIADILLPSKAKKIADEPMGGAWFAAEPSQFLEENRPLTQDDIALMRADILEFDKQMQQQRDPSSGSSKTKSSLSSIEAARAGAMVDPLQGLGLDIGVPMPEDDLMGLAPPEVGRPSGLEDPFNVDGARPSGQIVGEEADAAAPKRRVKIVNILDSADTALTREQVQRQQENRSDILCAERRHGPLDEDEARHRQILRNAEQSVNCCFAAPLAPLANLGLVAVFEAAMQQTVRQAEEVEAARASAHEAAASATRASKRPFAEDEPELQAPAVPPMDDMGFDYQVPEEPSRLSRKRGREDQNEDGTSGFSASTLATLDRLRNTLQKNVKSVTFGAFTHGKKRAEVARSFVDILVLASHGRVEVAQRTPHGEIVLNKTDKLGDAVA